MYVYVRVRVCKVCSCVRVSEAVKLHGFVRLNDERVAFKAARHSRGSEQLVLRVSDTGSLIVQSLNALRLNVDSRFTLQHCLKPDSALVQNYELSKVRNTYKGI